MTTDPLPTQSASPLREPERSLFREACRQRDEWKEDALAYRAQTRRYMDALREMHRAVDEHDGSDADVARLEDALVQAREMAPYVPEPPDPEGF